MLQTFSSRHNLGLCRAALCHSTLWGVADIEHLSPKTIKLQTLFHSSYKQYEYRSIQTLYMAPQKGCCQVKVVQMPKYSHILYFLTSSNHSFVGIPYINYRALCLRQSDQRRVYGQCYTGSVVGLFSNVILPSVDAKNVQVNNLLFG